MVKKKKIPMRRLLRYNLLKHLPGDTGKRYFRKHAFLTAPQAFNDAIEKCAGMTHIDLGANIGEFSEIMAAKAKRVIAFEPDPWAYDTLCQRIKPLSNIEAINAAVGTSDGEITLYRHENFDNDPTLRSQSSSIFLSKTEITAKGAHNVELIDFLRFLRELDGNIGVLKIDIEGAEVDLLEALMQAPDLLKRIHYIFVETHEYCIPEQKDRVEALQLLAAQTPSPVINLYWH